MDRRDETLRKMKLLFGCRSVIAVDVEAALGRTVCAARIPSLNRPASESCQAVGDATRVALGSVARAKVSARAKSIEEMAQAFGLSQECSSASR
jgi:hypothetical protein